MNKRMKSKKQVSIITLLFSYTNQVFLIIQGIIFIPFYLNFFSLEVYGAWLATGNIIGILGMLDGGMNMVFSQKLSFATGQQKNNEFISIVSAGLIITSIIITIFILIGFTISPLVPKWTNISPVFYSKIQMAFIIACFAAGLGILNQNLAAIVGSWLDATINGISTVVSSLIGLLTIIVCLKFNLGVISIPLGALSKGLIGSILLSIHILRKKRENNYPNFYFDKTVTKKLIVDTIPMTFSNIGSAIANQSQFLIISNFMNPTATAVYAITIRVFVAVSSFIAPIASAIFNSIAHFNIEENTEKIRTLFNRIFSIQGLISIFVFGGVMAYNRSFITMWVGADKYGGDYLTILTFFALFVSNKFSFISIFFLALGNIKKSSIVNFIEIAVRLIATFVLIPSLGFLSFPIAIIISSIIAICLYINTISSSFKINNKECLFSLFTNMSYFLLVSISAIAILIYSSPIYNWIHLIFYASIYALLMILFALIFSKNTRIEVQLLLKKLKRTS